jgi:hypothetical protein
MLEHWQRIAGHWGHVPQSDGTYLFVVQHVYQRSHRRGAKALVVFSDGGTAYDAWFNDGFGSYAQPGGSVLATVRIGWGPHNERDDVVYVEAIYGTYVPDWFRQIRMATIREQKRRFRVERRADRIAARRKRTR